MGNNQRTARIILMGEDDDAETIIQLDFAPINVGRAERTISIEPLVDAPIVPTKSAEVTEVKPHTKPQSYVQNNTQEVSFVPLLFAGLMIGCISFSVGHMVGYYQGSISRAEVRK